MAIINTILIPRETANDDVVTVVTIFVKNRAEVEAGDLLAEMETSKTLFEVVSPCAGYVEIHSKVGDELKVGSEFALIHDKAPKLNNKPHEVETDQNPAKKINSPVFSESARKMIVQHGLEESVFQGSDFVRTEDVVAYLEMEGGVEFTSDSESIATASSTLTSKNELLPVNLPEIRETINILGSKKLEIATLAAGQNQLTSNVSVKIVVPKVKVDSGKSKIFNNLQNSLIPFLLSTTCSLLKKHPALNAFFFKGDVHYYKETLLGYALDLGEGIKVVNLGDISEDSAKEVKNRIIGHTRQYMMRRIPNEVMTGSTFTVTDLMAEGVTGFTPLINRFQSAILGISAIDTWDRSMQLTLTFDHRVTEGKQAARFLIELKASTESYLNNE